MTDSDEVLKHRTFYFSWDDAQGYSEEPTRFAVALSKNLGLSLTVVVATKPDIPDELSRVGYVTERSHHLSAGESVVLLLYPTRKLLYRPWGRAAKIVVAEWFSDPLEVWAARHDGYDVRTGRAMSLDISDHVIELYERIVWNGNNSWFDKAGQRDALRDLRELKARGELDKDELIGYLLGRKSLRALEQLEKLIDKA